jgi:hypothetical protein
MNSMSTPAASPNLYVSPQFLELAHGAEVTGMTPNPADIHTVLRHGSELYREGQLSTALGSVVLLGPEESADASGLRVFQVLPHDLAAQPPERLATEGPARGIEEVMAAHENGLVVPGATPAETPIAWAMYDAAAAKGNPTLDQMRTGVEQATALNKTAQKMDLGPLSGLGLQGLLGELVSMASSLTANAPALARSYDKPTIDQQRPVRLTRAG